MENTSTSMPSPLSPGRWPTSAFPALPSVLLALGVILVQGLAAVVLFVAIYGFGLNHHGPALRPGVAPPANTVVYPNTAPGGTGAIYISTTILLAFQDLTYVPLLALMFTRLPRLAARSWHDLGLRTPTVRDVVTGIAGAALAYIAVLTVEIVQTALTHHQHVQQETLIFRNLQGGPAALFILTALLFAPFVEEVIFRGFLLNTFLRYVPMGFAVVLSSLLFGLAHGQLDISYELIACGAVLALVYWRTGCLWSNVIAHGLFNSVAVAALFISHATPV